MYCAGVGIVESFFTMTVPKPILVIALIMVAVVVVFAVVIFRTIPAATPDRQAVPRESGSTGKPGGVGKIGARIPAGAPRCVCR